MFQKVARQLGIPEKRVEAVYCGYCKFIKTSIETNSQRITYNVPFLGKINLKDYAGKKDKDSCKEGDPDS